MGGLQVSKQALQILRLFSIMITEMVDPVVLVLEASFRETLVDVALLKLHPALLDFNFKL